MGSKKNLKTKTGPPGVESSFFVPKMYFTQEECLQATDNEISSKFANESIWSLPRHFSEVEFSKNRDTKLISFQPVNKSLLNTQKFPLFQNETIFAKNFDAAQTFNNAFSKMEPAARFDFDIAIPLYQKEPLQNPSSSFQSSKLVEEITSRIEKLPFLEKTSPFMTYAKIVDISEVKVNHDSSLKKCPKIYVKKNTESCLPSCARNADELLIRNPPSNEQNKNYLEVMEPQFSGLNEIFEKKCRISGEQKEFRFGNLSSSGIAEKPSIANEHILNKNIEKIANELLTKMYLQAEDSYFTYNSQQDEISLKYRQLYDEMHPNNYDFAMKLMAHIELLNDISWKETRSYLNDDVGRMFKYLWEGIECYVNKQTNYQKIDIKTFEQLLLEFTQSWGQEDDFNIINFLNYCVILCQTGVRARKKGFKDAPLFVIGVLRNRIEEIENSQNKYFECIVEQEAKTLVQYFKLMHKYKFY